MRSAQEDIELLDQYIKGRLNSSDAQALESRLSSEPNLKADLDAITELRQGMRAKGLSDKIQMMKGWEEEIETQHKVIDKAIQIQTLFSIKKILLAASVVLILCVGWWWLKSLDDVSKKEVYAWNDEEFYKYILHQTERNNQIDLDVEKTLAYNLFASQNFMKAKPKLQSLWQHNKDTLAYFYLGISEFSIGNKEKAKEILLSEELKSYPIGDLIKLCE